MYDLFIGSHERVLGANVFVKRYNEYIPGCVKSYSSETRKYKVVLENGKTTTTDRIYRKVCVDNERN